MAKTKAGTGARYMLDANAFDYILDRSIDPRSVRRLGDIYITTVQHGELMNVPDPTRRKNLLRVLSEIDPTVMPALPGIWLDELRWDDRRVWRDHPSELVKRFYGASRKPEKWKDAAIGETAALEGCVLVTDDNRFRSTAEKLGLSVMTCADAFSDLGVLPAAPDA